VLSGATGARPSFIPDIDGQYVIALTVSNGSRTDTALVSIQAKATVELPPVAPGDFVVIHDAGAYTLSMWSRYNSRQAPPVYGYSVLGGKVDLRLLKRAETVEDVLSFWGGEA
jgi:hypothetical protein